MVARAPFLWLKSCFALSIGGFRPRWRYDRDHPCWGMLGQRSPEGGRNMPLYTYSS